MRGIAFALVSIVILPLVSIANPIPTTVYFYDDMESGTSGWLTVDNTAFVAPNFHLDTYLAFDDPAFDQDYSWWCGTFDYDADGGYGNSWDDRLELPTVVVEQTVVERVSWGGLKARFLDAGTERPREAPRGVLPVLTFVYRHETEPAFDYFFVQAESAGVWVTLNEGGWDGSSGGWQDLGPEGYRLTGFGSELKVRFRFTSDGAWSDEDGLYDSDAGAVHLDNIVIYDYLTGDVLFSDDCQTGGVCIPGVPPAAGDWWHLVDRRCPAFSDPHSWWCGDDADTSHIPPNLDNSLVSPFVDLTGAYTCTVRFMVHSEVPVVDNDYYIYSGTVDGGQTWHDLAAYWGDFGQCDGWGTSGLYGYDLFYHTGPPVSTGAFMLTMRTTDDGCGPGVAGGAGVYLDDLSMSGLGYAGSRPWSAVSDRVVPSLRHRLAHALPETPYGR